MVRRPDTLKLRITTCSVGEIRQISIASHRPCPVRDLISETFEHRLPPWVAHLGGHRTQSTTVNDETAACRVRFNLSMPRPVPR
jgi:hypothetical protein